MPTCILARSSCYTATKRRRPSSKICEVFSFIKRNIDILSALPPRAVIAVIRKYLRDGVDVALKHAVKRAFINALRYALFDYREIMRLSEMLVFYWPPSYVKEDVGVIDVENLSLASTRFNKFARAVLSKREAALKAKMTGSKYAIYCRSQLRRNWLH
ncbi:MAG: hypothetical protein QXO15_06955 [Nitrososphaerota archaeon]